MTTDEYNILLEKAEMGDPVSQYELARVLFYGEDDIGVDSEKAIYWCKESAEQGYAKAMYFLAQEFRIKGRLIESFNYYLKAAEDGLVLAQYEVGLCYLYGAGCDVDKSRAVHWLTSAFNQGYIDCAFDLGMCYLYGLGVESDAEKAKYYFNRAASEEC